MSTTQKIHALLWPPRTFPTRAFPSKLHRGVRRGRRRKPTRSSRRWPRLGSCCISCLQPRSVERANQARGHIPCLAGESSVCWKSRRPPHRDDHKGTPGPRPKSGREAQCKTHNTAATPHWTRQEKENTTQKKTISFC